MNKLLIAIAIIILPAYSFADNGSECQIEAQGYEKTYEYLQNHVFSFQQYFETLSVRGVQKAEFFSCNGEEGYLLIQTHERSYIYKNVPRDVWEEFKFTNSIESYYVQHIRFSYIMV
jgi:hypothetical protein